MEVKIVRIEQYSGNKAIFYSAIVGDDKETLFEKFLKENMELYGDELKNIDYRIRAI